MKLKKSNFKNKTERYKYDITSGLLRSGKTENGRIEAMHNFSYDSYPYLETVKTYGKMMPEHTVSAVGSAGDDVFCTFDSGFYYNGEKKLDVKEENGFFTVFKNNVIIHSDKSYYDTSSGMTGNVEKEFGVAAIKCINGFGDGSVCGVNMMTSDDEDVDLTEIFSVGDCIFVPDKYGERYKGEHVVRAIDKERSALVFDPFEFGYVETVGGISVILKMPYFSQTCVCNDRIWGFCGGTVRACAKGNMFEWYKSEGEDSAFSADIGDLDEFIGCIEYEGYPIFFTRNKIYKVYGDSANNFSLKCCSTVSGLLSGYEKSLAYAGDDIFYLAGDKVMRFSGNQATVETDIFGKDEKSSVSAVSYDNKYILSYVRQNGEGALFIYDFVNRTWCERNAPEIRDFLELSGTLYAHTSDGGFAVFDGGESQTDGFSYELSDSSYLHFGKVKNSFPVNLLCVEIEIEMEKEQFVILNVEVEYDGAPERSKKINTIITQSQRLKLYLPPVWSRAWSLRIDIKGTVVLKDVEAVYTYH